MRIINRKRKDGTIVRTLEIKSYKVLEELSDSILIPSMESGDFVKMNAVEVSEMIKCLQNWVDTGKLSLDR